MHSWARERLDPQSKQTKAQEALIVCGGILYKRRNDKSPQDWAFEKRIWSHIEMAQNVRLLLKLSNSAKEAVLNAASNMGRCYSDHGFHDQAINLLEWSLAGQEQLLGDDHASTLSTIHSMASVLEEQSKYNKALKWYQRALDGKEKTLGKDHPSSAKKRGNRTTSPPPGQGISPGTSKTPGPTFLRPVPLSAPGGTIFA